MAYKTSASGRPVSAKGHARVEAILTATEKLLAEHNPEDLTLVMIANEAGIKRTLVYHLFPSRNDIFDHMAGLYYEELKQRCIDYFDPSASLDHRSACGGIASVYANFFNENPVAAKLLLGAADKGERGVQTVARPGSSLGSILGELMLSRTGMTPQRESEAAFPDAFQMLVELISTVFSFGMRKEGKISPKMENEAGELAANFLASKLEPDR